MTILKWPIKARFAGLLSEYRLNVINTSFLCKKYNVLYELINNNYIPHFGWCDVGLGV